MQVVLAGIGSLGAAIARRHARCECPLLVYNRTAAAAHAVREGHVQVIEALADIPPGSLVFTCLKDAAVLSDFIPKLFEHARPSILANLSTVGPGASKVLRATVEAAGVGYVECPVTGGPESAEAGRLTCFLSGQPNVVDRVEPQLKVFCGSVYRLGAGSEAQAVKVINNLMEAINLCGASEALALAERFGLCVPDIADALLGGRGSSVYLQVLLQGIAADYWRERPRVSMSIRVKDLRLAEDMLDQASLRSPIARETAQQFRRAIALLGEDVDQTRCFAFVRGERSGDSA